MDIETLKDISQLQQQFAKQARLAVLHAASASAPEVAQLAVTQLEQIVKLLEARVHATGAERDRLVARYNEEIKGHELTLAQMRKELDEERRLAKELHKESGGGPVASQAPSGE